MKNLPLAGIQPLFAFLLLVAFSLGCQKDNFSPIDEFPQTSPAANFPISVQEAMVHFGKLNLHPPSSFSDTTPFNFVPIDPLWERAFLGHSQSGREIVVVPLPDTSFRINNNGRAGAKLLFSKVGSDSILAHVLVYLADTAYYQTNDPTLNFNTFTGLFMLFDIGQHFITGVRVHDGMPVGRVKSIYKQGGSTPQDREEGDCGDCITHLESVFRLCQVFTFDDCYEIAIVESEECNCNEGGGSGGGGGGGSGSSGGSGGGGSGNSGGASGGGSGSGNSGSGGCLIPNPTNPMCFFEVFMGYIPVEVFIENGGTLPPGFDAQLFKKFVDVFKQFSSWKVEELQWLTNHPDIVPVIWNAFFGPPAGEEALMVRPVLTLAINNNLDLTGAQFQFLITHSAVFAQVQSITELPEISDEIVASGVQAHLNLMMDNDNNEYATLNSQANYPDIGTQEWAMTLKIEGIDPNPAEIALALIWPVQALLIFENAGIAFQKTEEFWGSSGLPMRNHKPDAFRHGYWLAINTKDVGSALAWAFSEAHESQVPPELALEKQMDTFNNGVGISKSSFLSFTSDAEFANIIQTALLNGELRYLSPLDFDLSPVHPVGLNGILPETQLTPTNQ